MNWMKSRSLALAAAALAAFVPLASTMGCNKPQVEQAKGEAAPAPAAAKALCLALGEDEEADIRASIAALADRWESDEARKRIRAFLG